MLQIIQGQEVFVVDFDTMPQLPITWNTPEERPYALALQDAIVTKQITEPGKYAISAVEEPLTNRLTYGLARIVE